MLLASQCWKLAHADSVAVHAFLNKHSPLQRRLMRCVWETRGWVCGWAGPHAAGSAACRQPACRPQAAAAHPPHVPPGQVRAPVGRPAPPLDATCIPAAVGWTLPARKLHLHEADCLKACFYLSSVGCSGSGTGTKCASAPCPHRLLALAAALPASAGPQQRAAAEAGLKLALHLDLPASSLLNALKVIASTGTVGRESSVCTLR